MIKRLFHIKKKKLKNHPGLPFSSPSLHFHFVSADSSTCAVLVAVAVLVCRAEFSVVTIHQFTQMYCFHWFLGSTRWIRTNKTELSTVVYHVIP